jgi:integrase
MTWTTGSRSTKRQLDTGERTTVLLIDMARKPKLGSIYKRGRIWWIKFYKHGNPRPFRESSGSTDSKEAERLLKQRQGEIVTGQFAGLGPERIRIRQLLDELVEDYKDRSIKSLDKCVCRIDKHLRPALGDIRAVDFGTSHIRAYKRKRRQAGAAPATINRELELLQRAFRLAYQSDPPMVSRVPHFDMLVEGNVRTGTLDHDGYRTLRDSLPPHYRLLLVIGYHTGARLGELLSIRWSQVDLRRRQIRLEAGDTKTGKARILPIYGEMVQWLEVAEDTRSPGCPWLFEVRGKQMVFNWRTWNRYRTAAGIDGLRFHDLRRTALTNMVRAGIPEKEAMAVSGHLTRRTFERYHIVSERSVLEVARKMENYLAEEVSGTISGTEPGTVDRKLLN